MTNTRTQSNLRQLKSRNQREGWYDGKSWTGRHNGMKKCHRRNMCWGLKFKVMHHE